MLVLKNIDYQMGELNLSIRDLQLPGEGLILLSGDSGCGKSTLVNLLVGFIDEPSLKWSCNGQEMQELTISEKRVGLVLQGAFLFPHLTAIKCVFLAAKARGESPRNEDIESLFASLNLPASLKDKKVRILSGGERQRLALICAVVGRPRLLILDEPFSALDNQNKEKALEFVYEYCQVHKLPALIISHDALNMAKLKKKFVLHNGEIHPNM